MRLPNVHTLRLAEFTNLQDYKIANVTSAQLRNHVSSAFNLKKSRFVRTRARSSVSRNYLKPRVVIVIASPQIAQSVRRGTKKSRFLNPGPYTIPLDRSRSFPIERVDTIHMADHAERTEQ